MTHMERDKMSDRERAHINPSAQGVRQWAVEQVVKLETGLGEAAVAQAADVLATYVLTGKVEA